MPINSFLPTQILIYVTGSCVSGIGLLMSKKAKIGFRAECLRDLISLFSKSAEGIHPNLRQSTVIRSCKLSSVNPSYSLNLATDISRDKTMNTAIDSDIPRHSNRVLAINVGQKSSLKVPINLSEH